MAILKAILWVLAVIAEVLLFSAFDEADVAFWLFQVSLVLGVLIPFMRVQPVIQLQIADVAEERAESEARAEEMLGDVKQELEESRVYFNDEIDEILNDVQQLRKMVEEQKKDDFWKKDD